MRSWLRWSVCTRILVKNVLSHYCKLRDYHYPPGFHHVVSAVLTLWSDWCYSQQIVKWLLLQQEADKYLLSVVRWTCAWDFHKNRHFFSAQSIYLVCVWVLLPASLHCEPAMLSVCSAVSSCLSRREYLWKKSWMTKTRWGSSASLYRGELMQCHYPFLFVLVFPTLCEGKFQGSKEKGYWRGTHGHDRATLTGRLIHDSIIIENVLLRLSLLLCLRKGGLWMSCESWAQKNSLFPSVAEIWIVSVWRFELLPSYPAVERNTKIRPVWK